MTQRQFTLRRATAGDIPVIARHRADMFSDMGQLPRELYQSLIDQAIRYLEVAVPSEEYLGWLAAPAGSPTRIVAGAGVQLRREIPHPLTHTGVHPLAVGGQGIVLNV